MIPKNKSPKKRSWFRAGGSARTTTETTTATRTIEVVSASEAKGSTNGNENGMTLSIKMRSLPTVLDEDSEVPKSEVHSFSTTGIGQEERKLLFQKSLKHLAQKFMSESSGASTGAASTTAAASTTSLKNLKQSSILQEYATSMDDEDEDEYDEDDDAFTDLLSYETGEITEATATTGSNSTLSSSSSLLLSSSSSSSSSLFSSSSSSSFSFTQGGESRISVEQRRQQEQEQEREQQPQEPQLSKSGPFMVAAWNTMFGACTVPVDIPGCGEMDMISTGKTPLPRQHRFGSSPLAQPQPQQYKKREGDQ